MPVYLEQFVESKGNLSYTGQRRAKLKTLSSNEAQKHPSVRLENGNDYSRTILLGMAASKPRAIVTNSGTYRLTQRDSRNNLVAGDVQIFRDLRPFSFTLTTLAHWKPQHRLLYTFVEHGPRGPVCKPLAMIVDHPDIKRAHKIYKFPTSRRFVVPRHNMSAMRRTHIAHYYRVVGIDMNFNRRLNPPIQDPGDENLQPNLPEASRRIEANRLRSMR